MPGHTLEPTASSSRPQLNHPVCHGHRAPPGAWQVRPRPRVQGRRAGQRPGAVGCEYKDRAWFPTLGCTVGAIVKICPPPDQGARADTQDSSGPASHPLHLPGVGRYSRPRLGAPRGPGLVLLPPDPLPPPAPQVWGVVEGSIPGHGERGLYPEQLRRPRGLSGDGGVSIPCSCPPEGSLSKAGLVPPSGPLHSLSPLPGTLFLRLFAWLPLSHPSGLREAFPHHPQGRQAGSLCASLFHRNLFHYLLNTSH